MSNPASLTRFKVIILALTTTASAAQAGAWDEFEARCLVPMENVEQSDVSGLSPSGKTSATAPFGKYYSDPNWGLTFLISGEGSWCGLILTDPNEGNLAKFTASVTAWTEAAISTGRYFELVPTKHRRHFQSTEWREPRIEVSVRVSVNEMQTGEPVLIAKETDLES